MTVEVEENIAVRPKFVISTGQDNQDGWGPNSLLEQFKDLPYQPFSKSDRLGRIADWTGMMTMERRNLNKYIPQIGAGSSRYSYYHEQDESTFHLVDTSKLSNQRSYNMRGRYQRGRMQGGGGRGQGRWTHQNMMMNSVNTAPNQVLSKAQKNKERERQRQVRFWQQQQKGRQNMNRSQNKQQRESSVLVRPEWVVIEEMERSQLAKLSLPSVSEPVDLYTCGVMNYYEKQSNRINVKNEKPLRRIDRVFHFVTTHDDPIIRKLSRSESDANVFATDSILTTLMCCTRSVYSWDIVVQKVGGKIFLDKRENTEFDLLTVNETSSENIGDDVAAYNSPRHLALEATFITHNFSQQVLKGGPTYKFDHSNPFIDEDDDEGNDNSGGGTTVTGNSEDQDSSEQTSESHEQQSNSQQQHSESNDNENAGEDGGVKSSSKQKLASVGYRYRKWDLGNNIKLIARTEHDAVTTAPNNQDILFMNIKALNEWDPKLSGSVNWREKLEGQRGAVLANELKNNSCKLAKWTLQAILAGSDLLKFGYVSRFNVKDANRHVILGTQHFKPAEFAAQINLSVENCWGILRCIVELIRKQKDGKYLIVKDPMKSVIRLYDIPDSTFESSSDDSDEEDDIADQNPDSDDDLLNKQTNEEQQDIEKKNESGMKEQSVEK